MFVVAITENSMGGRGDGQLDKLHLCVSERGSLLSSRAKRVLAAAQGGEGAMPAAGAARACTLTLLSLSLTCKSRARDVKPLDFSFVSNCLSQLTCHEDRNLSVVRCLLLGEVKGPAPLELP